MGINCRTFGNRKGFGHQNYDDWNHDWMVSIVKTMTK